MTDKKVKLTIVIDSKGAVAEVKQFGKKTEAALDDQVTKPSKKATKAVGGLEKGSRGLGLAWTKAVPGLIAGSAAIAGIVAISKKAITAAGDKIEIYSKFIAVFKDQATVALSWAGQFSEAVGRAKTDVVGWMSTLQDTFVPLGFARDKAAELSMSLVDLAVDVASFNNAADADVIRDFQSALVGNHETVRKYGIVITEATLKEEALNSGIIETARNLTNQEKVQARLNIIIQGTTDAQGDALRTAESYNNQLKRAGAEVKEFSEALGAVLLPAAAATVGIFGSMTRAATEFFKALVPATDMQERIDQLTRSLKKTADSMGLTVDELLELDRVVVLSGYATSDITEKIKEQAKEREALTEKLQEQIFVQDEAASSTERQKTSTHDLWVEIVKWQAANAGVITQLPNLSAKMAETEKRMKKIREAYGLLAPVKKEDIRLSMESAIAIGASADSVGDAVRIMLKQQLALMLANYLRSIFATIPFPANIILAGVGAATVSALFDKVIPKFQYGGVAPGGAALVGEEGAEMAFLPRGTRVISHRETKEILSSQDMEEVVSELRELRRDIARANSRQVVEVVEPSLYEIVVDQIAPHLKEAAKLGQVEVMIKGVNDGE